ncbi:MAG: hypothetical protein IIX68_06160 [Clostridia bacterium]|nr:hypothetical protein [Clostridia bacterium]
MKKFLAVLFAICMLCLLLVGCGEKPSANGGGNDNGNSQEGNNAPEEEVALFKGPLKQLSNGVAALEDAENFTLELSVGGTAFTDSASLPTDVIATLNAVVDAKQMAISGSVDLDPALLGLQEEVDISFGVLDKVGYASLFIPSQGAKQTVGVRWEDLVDYANAMADLPENAEQKELLDIIQKAIKDLQENTFDLAAFLDSIEPGTSEEAAEYIKLDQVVPTAQKLFDCLEKEEWLKANLGMNIKKEGNTVVYTFSPKLDKLYKAILEEVKPVFVNESDYNELVSEMNDAFKDYDEDTFKAEMEFAIVDGQFSGMRVEITADGENLFMEYKLGKMNASTVNTQLLNTMKAEAAIYEFPDPSETGGDELVSSRVDMMA